MPFCWVNPLATSRALCHSTVPSALNFVLYTHLQPTGCLPTEREQMDQVLLLSKALNSTSIASRQT